MMSNFKIWRLVKLIFLVFSLSACSEDDELAMEAVHLTANVEGEKFEVNSNKGTMRGEKRLSAIGTVDLTVKAEDDQGKSIEFLIFNYNGKNSYPIGAGFFNDNWIRFSQTSPEGIWAASRSSGTSTILINSIEITSDDGQRIKGHFSFEGRESKDSSRRLVTDGDFDLSL